VKWTSACKANPYHGQKRIKIATKMEAFREDSRQPKVASQAIRGKWMHMHACKEAEKKSVKSNLRMTRVRQIGGCVTQCGCSPHNSAEEPRKTLL
jgi:hypothetical protein